MKYQLKLVFAFLLIGSSAVYGQSAAEFEAKPFHISSRGSAYGVQGEFEGTYRVHDSSIEVDVSKATLYVSTQCPYQGRRRINYIAFGLGIGLGNGEKSGWKLENRADSAYLYVVMSPGEEYSVSDLHFSLPIERTPELAKRWLVVELQADTLDPVEGQKGYTFSHSCTNILLNRQGAATDQKAACKR